MGSSREVISCCSRRKSRDIRQIGFVNHLKMVCRHIQTIQPGVNEDWLFRQNERPGRNPTLTLGRTTLMRSVRCSLASLGFVGGRPHFR